MAHLLVFFKGDRVVHLLVFFKGDRVVHLLVFFKGLGFFLKGTMLFIF